MWTFISGCALVSGTIATALLAADGRPMPTTTVSIPASASSLTIAEFNGDDLINDADSGRWFTVNDDVMGGRSLGGGSIRNGALVLAGTLNTAGGGFASVRASDKQWDLSDYDGLTLRVRGDARRYEVRIQTGERVGNRTVSYRGTFTTTPSDGTTARDATQWRTVFVPFDSFVATWRGQDFSRVAGPLDPSSVRQLGLSIGDGVDAAFYVEVDWIQATVDTTRPRTDVSDDTI